MPKVVEIQRSLSALEDINNKVVKDAGSGPESLQRDQMAKDLRSLEDQIELIELSFRALREQVQIISLPEMTDVERLGESLVRTRDLEVYKSLKILGYEDENGGLSAVPKVDYAGLKASSDKRGPSSV